MYSSKASLLHGFIAYGHGAIKLIPSLTNVKHINRYNFYVDVYVYIRFKCFFYSFISFVRILYKNVSNYDLVISMMTFFPCITELSLCHKLQFSNPVSFLPFNVVNFRFFKIMNSVISNKKSLTRSCCKDIGIRKIEFVAVTEYCKKCYRILFQN